MGGKKSSRKIPTAAQKRAVSTRRMAYVERCDLPCVFCKHDTVTVRIEKNARKAFVEFQVNGPLGYLRCSTCDIDFIKPIDMKCDASQKVDIYYFWIDACEAVNSGTIIAGEDKTQTEVDADAVEKQAAKLANKDEVVRTRRAAIKAAKEAASAPKRASDPKIPTAQQNKKVVAAAFFKDKKIDEAIIRARAAPLRLKGSALSGKDVGMNNTEVDNVISRPGAISNTDDTIANAVKVAMANTLKKRIDKSYNPLEELNKMFSQSHGAII